MALRLANALWLQCEGLTDCGQFLLPDKSPLKRIAKAMDNDAK